MRAYISTPVLDSSSSISGLRNIGERGVGGASYLLRNAEAGGPSDVMSLDKKTVEEVLAGGLEVAGYIYII